jgi:hypothetical protein
MVDRRVEDVCVEPDVLDMHRGGDVDGTHTEEPGPLLGFLLLLRSGGRRLLAGRACLLGGD